MNIFAEYYFNGRADRAEFYLRNDLYEHDQGSTPDQLAERFFAESALILLGIVKSNRNRVEKSFRAFVEMSSPAGADISTLARMYLEFRDEYLPIGKGSYNIAFLNYRDNVILRVGECEGYAQVQRGLQISKLISGDYNCGPSLLREFGHSSEPGYPPAEVRNYLEDEEIYCWQKLEYLETSFDKCDVDVAYQCLVWYFAELQSNFGFQHKDFKLPNMMIRRYHKEQTFIFSFGDESHFKITSQYIPVVLDLDFATLPDTNMEWQMEGGTYYTRPPEKILLNSTYYTYDYWSLGITLLEMRIPYGKMFPQAPLLGIELGNYFYNHVRIKRALGDSTEIPQNYLQAIPEVHRGLLNSIIYAELSELIDKQYTANQKAYINHLLSWNPADRDFFGNPFMLFKKFFRAESQTWLEKLSGWVNGVNRYSMEFNVRPYWKMDTDKQREVRERGVAVIKSQIRA